MISVNQTRLELGFEEIERGILLSFGVADHLHEARVSLRLCDLITKINYSVKPKYTRTLREVEVAVANRGLNLRHALSAELLVRLVADLAELLINSPS